MRVFTLVVFLFLASIVPCMASDGYDANLNFLLGQRNLNKNDWQPVETQTSVDIGFDFGKEAWPAHLYFGSSASVKEATLNGVPVKGTVSELDIGLKKYFSDSGLQPYVGIGLAALTAEISATSGFVTISDSDKKTAYYGQIGFVTKASEHFNIGLEIKALSGADITLFGTGGTANYTQFALLLGYAW